MRTSRLAGIALLAPAVVFGGDRISFGVRGGVPMTDALKTSSNSNVSYMSTSKPYLIGPTVEVRLVGTLWFQVDALYKRLGYQFDQQSPFVSSKTVANSWEFPVLGKIELLPGPIRPFLNGGANFRNISGIDTKTISGAQAQPVESDNTPELDERNLAGFSIGGGIALKIGRMRLAPEFRYTRWGGESFRDTVNDQLRTNRNQVDFIVGLTF